MDYGVASTLCASVAAKAHWVDRQPEVAFHGPFRGLRKGVVQGRFFCVPHNEFESSLAEHECCRSTWKLVTDNENAAERRSYRCPNAKLPDASRGHSITSRHLKLPSYTDELHSSCHALTATPGPARTAATQLNGMDIYTCVFRTSVIGNHTPAAICPPCYRTC